LIFHHHQVEVATCGRIAPGLRAEKDNPLRLSSPNKHLSDIGYQIFQAGHDSYSIAPDYTPAKPRESAIMAEINGVVKYGEISKGQRKIYVMGEDGDEREYSLPRGVHINVQEGEKVMAGDPLMDGPRNPHDILDVRGEKELQKYLVNEIQEVYRLQGVNINDKHLEVISRQK
jgi:hypothetical protein